MRKLVLLELGLAPLLAAASCSGGGREPVLGEEDGQWEDVSSEVEVRRTPEVEGETEACTPGAASCDGNAIIICLPDGSDWDEPWPCPGETVCQEGQCLKAPECDVGEATCDGNAVTSCQETSRQWSAPQPCGKLETCDAGNCVEWPDGACTALVTCMEESECPEDAEDCFTECMSEAPVGVADFGNELRLCVAQACGSWEPQSMCYAQAKADECRNPFELCTGECIELCDGKECGGDGCGGSCGQCPQGLSCNPIGQCSCESNCEGKTCGPDGCGAICGTCYADEECGADGLCHQLPPGPCGNGDCEADKGESCKSCAEDCGECPPCGNGICDAAESCEICPGDCGPCNEGDCCKFHDVPGCGDPAVSSCVCGIEPDCCAQSWHNVCVELAKDCGAEC